MKLSDFIPPAEDLQLVQGVEADLLRRKRTRNISGVVALAAAILQIVVTAITREEYLERLGQSFSLLAQWMTGKIPFKELFGPDLYQVIGLLVVVVGAGLWILFKWTGFLLKESEEPFRYTFSVKEFKREGKASPPRVILPEEDRFQLLHHDLTERINQRFKGRFSLLEDDSAPEEQDAGEKRVARRSHIHIRGHYAIREDGNGNWIVQVMPFVRIGPPGQPEVVVDPPVLCRLKSDQAGEKEEGGKGQSDASAGEGSAEGEPGSKKDASAGAKAEADNAPAGTPAAVGATKVKLTAKDYDGIVEQVFSRVASEIYAQMQIDLQEKIRQFPTRYLRAVALSHEAEDFARSNTVDAYDRAIALYREARRCIRLADWPALTRRMIRWPGAWRLRVRFTHRKARIQTGYAKALIYRREISALTGRRRNPIFEIRPALAELLDDLEELYKKMTGVEKVEAGSTSLAFLTFPEDSRVRALTLRPRESAFRDQRRLLFEAYTVNALAHWELGALKKAGNFLRKARAVDPQLSESNALFKMVEAMVEPSLERRIRLLRRAAEMAERFEFTQYLLARSMEMQLRTEPELSEPRAQGVLDAYQKVLEINPGNTAALAAQGYLYWLLEKHAEAKEMFDEGLKVKSIVRQTYVGVLNYGLARVAAEHHPSHFNKSYKTYRHAIWADPGVASYRATPGVTGESLYYDFLSPAMRDRYERFEKNVAGFRGDRSLKDDEGEVTETVKAAVYSWALNDYGNACLNFYFRFGDREKLQSAVDQFKKSIEENPENTVAKYNLQAAYTHQQAAHTEEETYKEIRRLVDVIADRMPDWQDAVIAYVYSLRDRERELTSARNSLEMLIEQTESYLEYLEQEIPVLTSQVHELQQSWTDIVSDALTRIFKYTNLSSVQDLEIDQRGKGVFQLLVNEQIDWHRLDEQDVAALQAWAELLSWTGDSVDMWGCELLTYHILEEYYPESFEVHLIRRTILNRLSERVGAAPTDKRQKLVELVEGAVAFWRDRDRGSPFARLLPQRVKEEHFDRGKGHLRLGEYERAVEQFLTVIQADRSVRTKTLGHLLKLLEEVPEETRERSDNVIKDTIKFGLDLDPSHYLLLSWHGSNYSLGEHRERLDQVRELVEARSVLLTSLARYHFDQGEYFSSVGRHDKAVEHCQLSLELDRSNPDYAGRLKRLEWRWQFDEAFGQREIPLYPVVTPIAMEVAADLIPLIEDSDTGELRGDFKDHLEQMRNRIREQFGVRVPGLRVRGNETDLPAGTYILMIGEVPLVSGTISPNTRLFPGTSYDLAALGVSGEETINPTNGHSAFWIRESDCDTIEAAGYGLWQLIEYPVRHLQSVLLKNLREFVGHQAIMNMVEEQVPEYYQRLADDPAVLGALTQVLRGLLDEGVPIVELNAIADRFFKLKDQELDLCDTQEAIRCLPEIRPTLPGNSARHAFFRLGPRFESQIEGAIRTVDGRSSLDLEPSAVSAALTAVRNRDFQGSYLDEALVVERAKIRPFVRELIQLEFPRIPVLSKKELLPNLKTQDMVEIELP